MKDTLGGKGAGLAEMTKAGLPVPPGFTISTDACNLYYELGQKLTPAIEAEIVANVRKLEKAAGATLGSAANPLLVSVRSGAKFSMPGMMDTILNLGLNDTTVEGLKARTSNGRFAFDSYRRFIQMYRQRRARDSQGGVRARVRGGQARARRGARHRSRRERPARGRRALQDGRAGRTPRRSFRRIRSEQLRGARNAVFRSWNNPRAQGIPPHLRHPRLDRHGRQRADDGVRQHRRSIGHRRRLHAEPRDRREGVLRRVPDQRPGRGRRRRHPHAAADRASSRR